MKQGCQHQAVMKNSRSSSSGMSRSHATSMLVQYGPRHHCTTSMQWQTPLANEHPETK
jgi:hypothetical protein